MLALPATRNRTQLYCDRLAPQVAFSTAMRQFFFTSRPAIPRQAGTRNGCWTGCLLVILPGGMTLDVIDPSWLIPNISNASVIRWPPQEFSKRQLYATASPEEFEKSQL